MKVKLGLTGSIGMGKSTTAQFFVEEGCDLWDADAAVHRLYAEGGAAVAPMKAAFPEAVPERSVSRAALKSLITEDPAVLRQIEAIVHPLVAEDRAAFVQTSQSDILVFDIPLLFETGGEKAMDVTVVVSAPEDVQRQRVLSRGTMTEAQFEQIRSKQMPDAEKRRRADHVIVADTLEHAREQVHALVKFIRKDIGTEQTHA